jgi:hypothetical protein
MKPFHVAFIDYFKSDFDAYVKYTTDIEWARIFRENKPEDFCRAMGTLLGFILSQKIDMSRDNMQELSSFLEKFHEENLDVIYHQDPIRNFYLGNLILNVISELKRRLLC